jgi:hypothetical protein
MDTIFWSENLKGRGNSEDLGVDGNIILQWILREIGWEGIDWMHLAEDRDGCQVLVNTIMNLRVSSKVGVS